MFSSSDSRGCWTNKCTTVPIWEQIPQLWIQLCIVSVCSYCLMHNPLLEVCCLLLKGQLVQGLPAALRGNVWTKKLSHFDSFIPAKECRFQNHNTDLVHCFFSLEPETCPGGELCQQLTSYFLTLPHSWGDRQRDGKLYSHSSLHWSYRVWFSANALRDCGRAAQTSCTTLLIGLIEVILLFCFGASTNVAVTFIRWPSLVHPASQRLGHRLADWSVRVFMRLLKTKVPQTITGQ